MAPSKTMRKAKSSAKGKKLSRGKKMNEVKPLAVDYFMNLSGIKGESQDQ